ncbi:phage tail tape measure protein, partial [Xanthobacter sp. TB0136]|uniref:phage tail tape measure protein n=1 Tax=Xanthobacter sp. TB0136 TaxID=3459177 RepID=UPI0040390A0C
MATMTSQLILSLVDRVTGPSKAVTAGINNLQRKLKENNRQLDEMRGRVVEAAAVGITLYKALQAPTKAAMEFESALADVSKVVDFAAGADGVKQFGRDLMALSERIPVAAEDLTKVAVAAGQFGLK